MFEASIILAAFIGLCALCLGFIIFVIRRAENRTTIFGDSEVFKDELDEANDKLIADIKDDEKSFIKLI